MLFSVFCPLVENGGGGWGISVRPFCGLWRLSLNSIISTLGLRQLSPGLKIVESTLKLPAPATVVASEFNDGCALAC
jgi:hypothetical protein